MIRLNRQKYKEPFVQISPMIDLVFLLLVFFIVSTMYMNQVFTVPVALPEGTAARVQQKAVDVAVREDGSIYLESKPVSPAELETAVHSLAQEKASTPVILRADKNVSYGRVVTVLEILKKAGMTDFSLAVESGGKS
jgi:biopolymer transport protein ExbD